LFFCLLFHDVPSIMTFSRLALSLILPAFLLGCSQKASNLADTYSMLYQGFPDATYSRSDINALPYASIYARLGEGPRGFLVLAFAEPNATTAPTLKWLSADQELIATTAGRITKTLTLPGTNLVAIHSDTPDPLALGLMNATTPQQWQFQLDFMPGYHIGYQANSQFKRQGQQTITINEQTHNAALFTKPSPLAPLNANGPTAIGLILIPGDCLKPNKHRHLTWPPSPSTFLSRIREICDENHPANHFSLVLSLGNRGAVNSHLDQRGTVTCRHAKTSGDRRRTYPRLRTTAAIKPSGIRGFNGHQRDDRSRILARRGPL
jgi:Protein of unknown function (DUF2886).